MVVFLIIPAIVIIWGSLTYNLLVRQRVSIKNAWSQIDVQLKRRYDLIPNLVEVAKGYMAHERQTLENVTKARQQAIDASGVQEQVRAENLLTQTLRSLFAVVENYPDLKANQNMLSLQEELASTENRISFARQFYNDEVAKYNARIQSVPVNLIASSFGFTKEEFFEIEDSSQREAPKIKF
ncbi:TPA: hypothetical protein DCX15_03465 [bacterium]|nr:hypothetical protein [bacterium]